MSSFADTSKTSKECIIEAFVNGLKSRSDEVRYKTARELQHYVATELPEMSVEDVTLFMDTFNKHIFDMMVTNSDLNDKKGGILAIIILVGVDVGNRSTRCSRFANYLRSTTVPNDTGLMELMAYAVGRVAIASGTLTASYVDYEVKRAIEWLSGDRNESKRHGAVLILRELATSTPTYFFQQIQQFFECIFTAIRDPKKVIRESGGGALRAALAVTASRETKESQKPTCYKFCYDEALKGFDDSYFVQNAKERSNRDDRIHGSLIVLNELLRCSNIEGERIRQDIEETSYQQLIHESGSAPSRYQLLREWGSASLNKSLRALNPSNNQQYIPPGHGLRGLSAVVQYHKNIGVAPGTASHTRKLPLYESPACKQLVFENFDEICQTVMRSRSSRNPYVQHVILVLLPRLAALDASRFVKNYLSEVMSHLLNCLKRERERSQAFIAVGLLAMAVKDEINPYLPRIMEVIKASLPARDLSSKKKGGITEPAVFTCISLVAKASGLTIKNDIKELLDLMIATGLSPALTAALQDLSVQIPQLKKDIQDGLLKMLSHVLMQRPYRHPGAPKHLQIQSSTSPVSSMSDQSDLSSVILALKILGKFDFQSRSLMQFVEHCSKTYLTSDNKTVRLEAVKTCCQLLTPALQKVSIQYSPSLMITIQDVLSKLLIVGVTDSEPQVRYTVLAALDERFDGHLAQAENLSALFICLNDEVFEIRELALCTIGRLSSLNPAYVMPSLRKILLQLLTDLEYSGIGRNKEISAKMLGHLISNAPRLIRPYTEPIIRIFISKLKDSDQYPSVLISILAAIGAQAQVSGVEMRNYVDELFPIILDVIQDSSSLPKREVGLWALAQLVDSTGYVVEPYWKYPNLLDILLNFLKTEQSQAVRREAIRVLGLFGAVDPYKHKLHLGIVEQSSDSLIAISDLTPDIQDLSASEMLVNMSSSYDDFYPAIAIATLMRIMKDPSLSQHHTMVVQAITFIFINLGVRCVPYIQQVLPAFINVIRSSDPSFREFLFQQLGSLISIVKQHIRNFLDDIFTLIKDFWTVNSPLQPTLIHLVEQIVVALGSEFKIYLPQLIPHVLRVFAHDDSRDRIVTEKLLTALQEFGSNLDDYLHLILPPIVKMFDARDVPTKVRETALKTIDILSDHLEITDFASRIIHPLVRVLDSTPELRDTAMNTLCALVVQLGKKYSIFIPMTHKILTKHHISHSRYDAFVTHIMKGTTIAGDEGDLMMFNRRTKTRQHNPIISNIELTSSKQKLASNTMDLKRYLGSNRRVSKDDWLEWLKLLCINLLKESPSLALRSCYPLAQTYSQLSRDLFNAAFLAFWSEQNPQQQQEFVKNLQLALNAQDIPEITQTLLNLAEFMEHCDKGPLPLNPQLLAEKAIKCRAFAKALHYKEDEFHKGVTTEVLESLISINNKLQQPEAAYGVLAYATKTNEPDLKVSVRERWYEKLHDWEKALNAYQKNREQNFDNIEAIMGQMRCLEELGEWNKLYSLAGEVWPKFGPEAKQRMARMAAAAAWGLGQWEDMEEYTNHIKKETTESSFFQAVLEIHNEHFSAAQLLIDKARDLIDTDLTAMAGESHSRAYGAMVQVMMLSELEEVIQYKLVPERREIIKKKWWERLNGCQRNVEDWQKILQVQLLVLNLQENTRSWLKFASLCQRTGRTSMSQRTLSMLLGMNINDLLEPNVTLPMKHPQITFACIKHLWKSDKKQEAFALLHAFVDIATNPQAIYPYAEDPQQRHELNKLLSRCSLKLGAWQENLQGINESSIPMILKHYEAATERDKNWYKACHAWAFMNYEAVLFYKQKQQQMSRQIDRFSSSSAEKTHSFSFPHVREYTIPAVRGFFHSISLSHGNSLQDALRLLTLWFDEGQHIEVYEAIVEGLKTVPVETWLQVIPQLIARLDTPRQLVGRMIHQLLMDIGKHHPQALIYPLTVSSKSTVPARQQAANKILNSMREHSSNLVQQAMLVSEELIRVAILWHELWHEGLEEASRLYFGEKNIKGMFETLEPLHSMMERGPQTLKEMSFNQAYGRDLMEALEWCRKYQRSGNVKDLTQAWDLYYHVFRRISKQLPALTSLELQYVSPKLLNCRDLELAVPGSYNPNKPIIRIAAVESSLQVITSKQRPRKLSIKGSNGKDFMFLLKGHEDLRQDERVMQLFGLVNTLLMSNPETSQRNLGIQRYAVIPLSTNSGLIGWVPHCDTLHTLIRDYREKKKILLNIEHRIMLRMAPDYEHLTLMQKVEVFEHALEHTQGDDLAKLLWLKSPSSEVWFDRRTNYTRSLAVMSMVGYVLGLGDRHPSNLMLDRMTGKILHIDFGDCFEVAMTREKFPEKIPFRLTRMLINAMEVTGIEGTYRITCQNVMQVLRKNKDSLMAVLEAFVYDPLLNWRLIDAQPKTKHSNKNATESVSASQEQLLGIDRASNEEIKAGEAEPVGAFGRKAVEENDSDNMLGLGGILGVNQHPEYLNKKALAVVNRVRDKLTGKDFDPDITLAVSQQVDLLIKQATSHENLCQCYIGWCPFW
ncbi:hypothetical protein B4U79_12736 [Dinothrombium tinctorium]|uniref:Serine/threonine-protein kinase TOR n=1 Tax=Dinothrombium tinctorium TaxID=1965070 RepID=A0A3S3PYF2_9ACAR|nr:hypothetical protein B4U79_12736 [Dinothrombium tinctorium]